MGGENSETIVGAITSPETSCGACGSLIKRVSWVLLFKWFPHINKVFVCRVKVVHPEDETEYLNLNNENTWINKTQQPT